MPFNNTCGEFTEEQLIKTQGKIKNSELNNKKFKNIIIYFLCVHIHACHCTSGGQKKTWSIF